jgi:hypothetical protein
MTQRHRKARSEATKNDRKRYAGPLPHAPHARFGRSGLGEKTTAVGGIEKRKVARQHSSAARILDHLMYPRWACSVIERNPLRAATHSNTLKPIRWRSHNLLPDN